MKYKKLFEPGKIGNLDVKNRIAFTGLGVNYAESNGEPGKDFCAFYEERAKGGTGLIIVGGVGVDPDTGLGEHNAVRLDNLGQAMGFARLAKIVHKYDTKLFVQLMHPGKNANSSRLNGKQAWSSSAVMTSNGKMAKEMTIEDIYYVVKRFADSALLAKHAGLDGVEIHAAHGYLLTQFLTPYFNKRTDMYGGSLENRMRIIVEIYNAIRKAVGPKFVVGIRLSVDEFIEGGNTLQEGLMMAKICSDLGMDFVDVSCGLQETGQFNREPPSFEQGWKKNLAKSVKEVVKCPVIAVNTIKKPDFAESLLDEGVSDFIGLSRPQLADPFWAKKAKEGKEDEIRTCISCLNCFATLVQGVPLTCAVNPAVGRELEFERLNEDGDGRVVAVVGGGPGGIEAAQILAKRGFAVTLLEKEPELGGQLNLANKPPMKDKITWLKAGMEAQLRNAGVKVLLNTVTTVEKIKGLNPIAVFCCVGSTPIRPANIPGINRENVLTVPDILGGKVQINNKNVVIIGTGLSGLECGNYLTHRGCRLTFVEMNSVVGLGIWKHVLEDEMKELDVGDSQIYLSTKLAEITPDGVKCVDEYGKNMEIKADVIVLAMGVTPRRDLVKTFKDNFENVILVGDANQSGRILEATTDGFTKAWIFE